MMRIARYLAVTAMQRTLVCLGLLVAVFVTIDVVEVAARAGARHLLVLSYYLFKVPLVIAYMLPLSLLLGMLLAMATLTKRGEWDLLQASGIPPIRLFAGLFATPVGGALLSAVLLTAIAPACVGIWHRSIYPVEPAPAVRYDWTRSNESLTRRGSDGSVLGIALDNRGAPRIWTHTDTVDGTASTVWRAAEGWRDDTLATGAAHMSRQAPGQAAVWPSGELPGSSMSAFDLARVVDERVAMGVDPTAVRAELALRVALFTACLLLPLAGIWLGARRRIEGATGLLAKGLTIAFVFWILLAVAWNGATAGAWSVAWISAGVPAVFGAVAVLTELGVRAFSSRQNYP